LLTCILKEDTFIFSLSECMCAGPGVRGGIQLGVPTGRYRIMDSLSRPQRQRSKRKFSDRHLVKAYRVVFIKAFKVKRPQFSLKRISVTAWRKQTLFCYKH